MEKKLVGAYRSASRTGWSSVDSEGRTAAVDEKTAADLEAARIQRNLDAGKPAS